MVLAIPLFELLFELIRGSAVCVRVWVLMRCVLITYFNLLWPVAVLSTVLA
eukprot:COSAG02_NODE_595_length_19813_cov_12.215380_19_plen_51_part_00